MNLSSPSSTDTATPSSYSLSNGYSNLVCNSTSNDDRYMDHATTSSSHDDDFIVNSANSNSPIIHKNSHEPCNSTFNPIKTWFTGKYFGMLLLCLLFIQNTSATLLRQLTEEATIPIGWRDHIHFHVFMATGQHYHACGGCMVLWELYSSLINLNISTSQSIQCPAMDQIELVDAAAANKPIVVVYPEIIGGHCIIPGNNSIHVHWILAPLSSYTDNPDIFNLWKKWPADDLVFNYASSTAVHPDLLPPSNILQVITSPTKGDQYDLPPSVFSIFNRTGTAWTLRKGHKWHREIDFIHEWLALPQDECPQSLTLTADIFMKYQYFVSYDPYTFYIYAAAMSGTISIVHPIANVTKKDWALGTYVGEYLRATDGDNVPGIAYGWDNDEIEYARRTMPELREFMMKVRKWGKENTVERFARDCYRYRLGDGVLEAGLTVHDAYIKWYDDNATNPTEGNRVLSENAVFFDDWVLLH